MSEHALYPMTANSFIQSLYGHPDAFKQKFKLRASAPPFVGKTEGKMLISKVICSSIIPETNMQMERISGGLSPKTFVDAGPGDVSSESVKDGGSNSFALSLEDFPLLPSCKKVIPSNNDNGSSSFDRAVEDLAHLPISRTAEPSGKHNSVQLPRESEPSGKHNSAQLPRESEPVGKLSPWIEGEFGSFGPSPRLSVISSERLIIPADDGSGSVEHRTEFQTATTDRIQDSSAGDTELLMDHQLLLHDDKEFPPLRR